MAGSDVFANARNPYTRGLAFQRPKSLAETKLDSLAAGTEAKIARLDPAAAVEAEMDKYQEIASRYSAGANSENMWDVAESSMYQAGSHLYDIFSDEKRTNQSILESSDLKAGLSAQGRDRMVTQPQSRVADDIAEGNYLGAAGSALLAAPATIADSAGSIAEIAGTAAAIGAAGLVAPIAAPVLGLAALGKKVYGAAKTADKVVDAVDAAKDISKIAKVTKSAIKAAPKAAAQVSVATADMTQRQVNTYRENFGEDPSTGKVIGFYAGNMSTMIFQPGIVKNLFIPSFNKGLKGSITGVVKNLVKGASITGLAKRVGSGITKVGASGLAEGTQEYVQSWVEVINTEIGPKDAGNFLDAVAREIGDKDNQLRAVLGGYLGFGAGAGIKSATTVPAVAAGTALDVTKATAKGAGYVAKAVSISVAKKTAKNASKYLSKAQTQEIKDKHAAKKVIHTQLEKDNNSKIAEIHKAKTFEDIKNEEVRNRFSAVAKTDELSDPKVFKKVKAATLASYKSDTAASLAKTTADHLANIVVAEAKRAGKAVIEASKYVGVTQERVDASIAYVNAKSKIIKEATINELKNIPESATRGLVTKALVYGAEKSSEAYKVLEKEANEHAPEAIRRIADTLKKDMPAVSAKLHNLANKKERTNSILKEGTASDVSSVKTLSASVKDVYQRNSIHNSTPSKSAAVGHDLLAESKNTIEDIDTVEYLEKVLGVYEADSSYVGQAEGSLSKSTVDGIRSKLAARKAELKDTVVEKAKDKVKAAAKYVDPALETASAAVKSAVKYVDDAIESFMSEEVVGEPNTDRTITDQNSKQVYKVKGSVEGETFISSVAENTKGIGELEGEEKSNTINHIVNLLTNARTVEKISEVFDTKDPDVIAAILVSASPVLGEKATLASLRANIKESLSDIDTSSTEIVSVEDSTPLDGSVMVDSDGVMYVNSLPTEEDIDAFIEATNLTIEDVCRI